LIEGKLTVRSTGDRSSALAPAGPLSLQPGDRLRLARPSGHGDGATAARVDRPAMDGVVAWKRNEAVFEDVSLADAVAELNRYNRTPIVLIGDASLTNLRVSGSFRTGDTAGFAHSVAALHHLTVRERDGRVELTLSQ
jgi:transmembrane sensor